MIIFDLDSLADDSHRRHFIDPKKYEFPCLCQPINRTCQRCKEFKPDWQAYNDACDGDKPMQPVISVMDGIYADFVNEQRFLKEVQIWSDRCESVSEKTDRWLTENVYGDRNHCFLKMRPIGDDSPQEELFEKWLRSESKHIQLNTITYKDQYNGHNIEMVFSSHKPTIEMFRRKGVFVFDCNQGGL